MANSLFRERILYEIRGQRIVRRANARGWHHELLLPTVLGHELQKYLCDAAAATLATQES